MSKEQSFREQLRENASKAKVAKKRQQEVVEQREAVERTRYVTTEADRIVSEQREDMVERIVKASKLGLHEITVVDGDLCQFDPEDAEALRMAMAALALDAERIGIDARIVDEGTSLAAEQPEDAEEPLWTNPIRLVASWA
jgi:hypothetical protein